MKLRYSMDGVKMYQGDARHLDAIEDGSIDMVITSPPYLNAREYSQWNNYADYLADMALAWAECYRVLCDGGRIAVNVVHGYGRPGNDRDGYMPIGNAITDQIVAAGFALRGIIIWNKTPHVMGTAWGSWLEATNPSLRDQHEIIIVAHKGSAKREGGESTIDTETFVKATSSIWVIPAEQSWHPAPFPAELPRRLIQLYTFLGDTVLDPFAGSGTTCWEALKAGRKGIGVEMKDEYIEKACGSMFLLPQERKENV